MYLTRELFVSKGACVDGLAKFCAMYPDGVELNAESIWAVRHEVSLDWVAEALLSPSAFDEYKAGVAASLKAYEDAKAAALVTNLEAERIAMLEYKAASAYATAPVVRPIGFIPGPHPAWLVYEQAVSELLISMDQATAALWDAHVQTQARLSVWIG